MIGETDFDDVGLKVRGGQWSVVSWGNKADKLSIRCRTPSIGLGPENHKIRLHHCPPFNRTTFLRFEARNDDYETGIAYS